MNHEVVSSARRSRVNFESLMGTCGLPSASALMHFPSAVSDRLIDLASSREDPPTPEKRPNFVDTWAFGVSIEQYTKLKQTRLIDSLRTS